MNKVLIFLSFALLFIAMAVAAEAARGSQQAVEVESPLADVLNLTEQQKTATQQLREELKARAEPLQEQLHQQWSEFRTLLESSNPDPTDVGNKAVAAQVTRVRLRALHDEFKTRFSALLTAEQRAKFEELQETRREHVDRFSGLGHRPDDYSDQE